MIDIKKRVYKYIEFENNFFINKIVVYNFIIYKINKQNNHIKYKENFH